MNLSARFALRLLVRAAVLALLVTAASAQSDYTTALPSVEKVKTQMQGSDIVDTTARQVAVLEYLQVYIDRIKSARDYSGPYTPGEQKLRADYGKAQYDITQSFTKSHTPDEVKRFSQLEGQYSVNNALDWIKQLQGQQAADTYRGAEAGLAQSYKQHEDNLQKQMKKDQGGGSGSIAGDPVLDPMGIFAKGEADRIKDPQLRRCLELGDSLDACQGVGAIEGMASILFPFGGKDDKNEPPPVAGVMLVGTYHSRTDLPEISLGAGQASIKDCGTLVEDGHGYNIRRSGETIQIVISNEPNPIVLTLQQDGSLVGPGSVQVKGRIITGYTTHTSTVMVNGAPAAAQGYYCNGPCSTSTSIPNYAPSMQRCTLSQFSPLPPPKPQAAPNLFGLEKTFGLDHPVAPVYGFRAIGPFISSNGLKLDFDDQTVVIDCGQAHIRTPYTVENTPTSFVIHVQNSGGAFLLAVAPDNTLRGSGSTTVSGKLVTAIQGDDVRFAPHSESCNVGTFTAQAKRNILLASNAPMPKLPASYPESAPARVAATESAPAAVEAAPASVSKTNASVGASMAASLAGAGITGANSAARVSLRVLLSSNFSGQNPLVGQSIFVTRKPMDAILRELGVAVPAKATSAEAMKLLQEQCHTPQGCSSVIQGLGRYYVTTTKFDGSGKATLSATAATGPYYFFAIVPDSGGSLVWDVPATLAAGDNSVAFTSGNAERIR